MGMRQISWCIAFALSEEKEEPRAVIFPLGSQRLLELCSPGHHTVLALMAGFARALGWEVGCLSPPIYVNNETAARLWWQFICPIHRWHKHIMYCKPLTGWTEWFSTSNVTSLETDELVKQEHTEYQARVTQNNAEGKDKENLLGDGSRLAVVDSKPSKPQWVMYYFNI